MEPSTSLTLISRASGGESEAWQRLVQIYGPLVYQWARRSGLQSADAADATQETLSTLCRDLDRFDADNPGAKFRGWLWTVLKRRIADQRRRRPDEAAIGSAINEFVSLPDDHSLDHDSRSTTNTSGAGENGSFSVPVEALPEQPPGDDRSARMGILRRAITDYRRRYDERTWHAFWMTVVEGREVEAVAEKLSVSKWAVYKARARVLQRLREEIGDL